MLKKCLLIKFSLALIKLTITGYPDCRPDFIDSFKKTINLGTKTGVDGKQLEINTPLINMSKKDIIKIWTQYGH